MRPRAKNSNGSIKRIPAVAEKSDPKKAITRVIINKKPPSQRVNIFSVKHFVFFISTSSRCYSCLASLKYNHFLGYAKILLCGATEMPDLDEAKDNPGVER